MVNGFFFCMQKKCQLINFFTKYYLLVLEPWTNWTFYNPLPFLIVPYVVIGTVQMLRVLIFRGRKVLFLRQTRIPQKTTDEFWIITCKKFWKHSKHFLEKLEALAWKSYLVMSTLFHINYSSSALKMKR